VLARRPPPSWLWRDTATTPLCPPQPPTFAATPGQADILFTSVGRPHSVTAEMVKPGAVVLDAGLNTLDGRLVGDVDFAAVREVAGFLTPSPGGLGPLTNLMLIRHTLIGPS